MVNLGKTQNFILSSLLNKKNFFIEKKKTLMTQC